MFDIFGKMDSYEEINLTAAGLKEENDFANIKVLAKENGLEQMTEAYLSGMAEEFTDQECAAMGRLDIEVQEYKNEGMPADEIVDYLKIQCFEDVSLAGKIMKKEKSLKECMTQVKEKCFEKLKGKNGCIADMVVFNWAKDYYIGG